MAILTNPIVCDGCGLAASPDHIAERVGRLELATRFRPIHVSTLFVALAPTGGIENDFYGPPVAKSFFDAMMKAAEIFAAPDKPRSESVDSGADTAKLVEFQHRGYYVAYLSECPIPADAAADAAILRLGTNLVRRIRFNYKPKQVVLLGSALTPLIQVLEKAGLGSLLPKGGDGEPLVPEALNVTSKAPSQSGSTFR